MKKSAKATYHHNQTGNMSSKPFILFFNPVRHAVPFFEKLQEVAHTEVVTSKSREEFFKDVADKYKNIFAIYRTSASGTVSIELISPNRPAPLCRRHGLKDITVEANMVYNIGSGQVRCRVDRALAPKLQIHMPQWCRYVWARLLHT
jgi:hypothetical protein